MSEIELNYFDFYERDNCRKKLIVFKLKNNSKIYSRIEKFAD